MPLDVIVLAAGQGKRMRSALPKVLHPLGGRPLLAHVLDTARALHARNTVVVHGHGAEAVRSAFADAGVKWVLQAEQLGTGHAVQQALPLLGGDGQVLILYGDVPLLRVANLERLAQLRQAEQLLDAGVSLADPARIDVRGTLECAAEVAIDVNCIFEGRVVLGESVHVGPNCVLRNVTVGADSEVHAFSHLEDSEIGRRCRVGPYARLRPGSSLADEVHIGNFVEVKASRLGTASKANHLSYIGDA